MLPIASRLSLREYPDFFSSSRKAYSPHLIVYWRRVEPTGATVVVSKKQFSLANKRNALKRRLREALKSTYQHWQDYQIVVMAKTSTSQLSVNEISQELRQIFSRIKS